MPDTEVDLLAAWDRANQERPIDMWDLDGRWIRLNRKEEKMSEDESTLNEYETLANEVVKFHTRLLGGGIPCDTAGSLTMEYFRLLLMEVQRKIAPPFTWPQDFVPGNERPDVYRQRETEDS